MRRTGQWLLAIVAGVAIGAPWLAPNSPDERFADYIYAPPTRVYLFAGAQGPALRDSAGSASASAEATADRSRDPAYVRGPHIYRWRLVNRLERRFEEDRQQPVPLRWFSDGRLVTTAEPAAPLLLLGADAYGRDVFARLLYGARASLALALAATLGAMFLGALIGGVAGYAGGIVDDVLSRLSEFVLVLPVMYVVLALRAVLPLVLSAVMVFTVLTGIFALAGWPIVARGVRAIVASEREREYAMAGRALGAGPVRLLVRHLLPAARGYLTAQATLLLPAFILAEATLSYVGLGFPGTTATWGTMLFDASNIALLGDAPWTLAPAAAIFIVVLAVNLVVQGAGRAPVQLEP